MTTPGDRETQEESTMSGLRRAVRFSVIGRVSERVVVIAVELTGDTVIRLALRRVTGVRVGRARGARGERLGIVLDTGCRPGLCIIATSSPCSL